ncbi:murein biosynthesis integral membrane protein MurJ [Rhodococcoides corynebacterioides]|uniref:murein biosynthesis integral membrane protein MurJ n=1 Tax=Rhodococcoides corynebacterioides TaxID=53972 RepID=UPI001C9BACCB|nr:murein biosynthesis integral membrane protein MurJ [Rhodococcus corynebacterioides]MBY6351547.1 peptidoglycan biosynthesis protein MviN [Rhodococcus corynebacterioides]
MSGTTSAEQSAADPSAVQTGADDRRGSSRLLSATGAIAFATLCSRITGFVKQLLLVTVLGVTVASSYTVASLIPNMIAELVLGAVLTAIVVPVLVRAESEDADGGRAFVRRLFTAALTMLVIAAVLATAAAPLLTRYVFLSDDGQVNTALTTALLFLLLPAILFYGLSALFTAILNTRQNFKPGAWAPVLNNLVVLAVLVVYLLMPGEISLDPVRISNPKLLVLGLGITLGVVVQATSLIPALRRNHIDLRPLWGLDDRLRRFGGMAVAIVLYVVISQIGMVVATRISSHVDPAGPVIYNQAWILLQLPYGVLGVTVLTAIMPRLSRNAAARDVPAVVDDLSVATRLTMLALVPVIGFLTVAGPQVGEALYGYGNFGSADAARLGEAVSWSAFTLVPYSLVLIHLRVFYAREQAWTPTWIVLGITAVKVGLSALAPLVASSDRSVVLLLGAANGLGYLTGAIIGWMLLRRTLGDLRLDGVRRTVVVTALATAVGMLAVVLADTLLGLDRLTGPAALLRVLFDGAVMLLVTGLGLVRARIPEIDAVTVAVRRRLGRATPAPPADPQMFAETELIPAIGSPDLPPVGRPTGGFGPTPHVGPLPYPVDREAPGTTGDRGSVRRVQNVPPDESLTTILPVVRTGSTRRDEGVSVTDDEATRGQATRDDGPARPDGGVHTDRTDDAPTTADASATATPTPAATPTTDDAATDPGRVVADEASTAPDDAASAAGEASLDPATTGVVPVGSPPLPPAVPPTDARRAPLRGPTLVPGASVAGGRYRLLAPHGGARGLKFWQAHDVKLDREVALTFVDAEQRADGGADDTRGDGPQAVLSRTLRLGRISSPGLARVLDVVRGSSGGIVVAEWTRGRSLREMADTTPSPLGAANAIKSLAAAAEQAHRSGGALSIDHPDRVRISVKGDAVLAFPATFADADPSSDVRGLGAMLYALVTARWPLGDARETGSVGGMALADRTAAGAPVDPREIRSDIPFEVSAVAVRALEQNSGIRTAATVQHILGQAAVVNEKTDYIPALRLGQRPPGATGHALADPDEPDAKSNRTLIVLAGLGALTVLVLGLVGWWLANLLAGGGTDEPLTEQNFGLTTSAVAPADPEGSAAPAAPAPVAISSVEVFSPQGTADSPATVDNVLDNDPATVWQTDSYFNPFPSLKSGVGILATLDGDVTPASVSIDSPSPGTVVEIRSASSVSPTLDDTQVIGQATLGNGRTDIAVTPDGPTEYLLVWITDLSTQGGRNQSSIADITVTAG